MLGIFSVGSIMNNQTVGEFLPNSWVISQHLTQRRQFTQKYRLSIIKPTLGKLFAQPSHSILSDRLSIVMRSSKMSLKSKILVFRVCAFFIRILFKLYLVKSPQTLGNWFLRNSILNDCKNNEKQKKLSALFGYMFKLIFVSSDSFCLIASQLLYCVLCYSKLVFVPYDHVSTRLGPTNV